MKKTLISRLTAITAGFSVGLYPVWGWAAETGASWRPTYDTVMLWVNFFILVALLVKFLRPHARKFLSTYKANLESEMNRLTSQKEKAAGDLKTFKESLQDRRKHWENRYQKILAQGERDYQTLIEEAQIQAGRLMDSANRQIEARVRDAGLQLQGEIVDTAIAVAMKELPGRMTPEIEQRWFRDFLKGISKASPPQKK